MTFLLAHYETKRNSSRNPRSMSNTWTFKVKMTHSQASIVLVFGHCRSLRLWAVQHSTSLLLPNQELPRSLLKWFWCSGQTGSHGLLSRHWKTLACFWPLLNRGLDCRTWSIWPNPMVRICRIHLSYSQCPRRKDGKEGHCFYSLREASSKVQTAQISAHFLPLRFRFQGSYKVCYKGFP